MGAALRQTTQIRESMEQLKKIVKDVKAKVWLKRETKPYGKRVFLLAVLSVLTTLSTLAFAYLVRYLINSATAGNTKQLWMFSAILLGTLLLKILLKTLNVYASEKLRAKMVEKLGRKLLTV